MPDASRKACMHPAAAPTVREQALSYHARSTAPYENGKAFCAARPSARLLTLNAGHNDLLMDPANGQAYFNAVRLLVHAAVSGAELPRDIPHAKGAKPARPSGFGSLA